MNERFDRGVAAIDGLGGGYQAIFEPMADVAPDLSRFVAEFAFGDLYSRPGLAPPQRQLLTIATLIALGGTDRQLSFHIGAALHVGVEPQTIVETIYHCLAYVGFPRTVNAMHTAKEVFAKRGLLPLKAER
ncbi:MULTISPECIES: carboxymuconolactone decarboxylase family protein [Actinokineospora]|uniref:4-carboxymuconolactone decarboxylase n=1 Tax=Actinokineospora fastidiosa TaxID=1816 RepID=A0A918GH26_9PSEU|nr:MULTISPECIES: carboxymuconolactone decarboxylase family protein [Actinokineospora]UVS80797.1 4-carboxymuconolactone decarboxylase [Actinokineospora sp. UTMC 2448]GGS37248.1 4-carboxymuconolactone decarboxylase [Actinokineospora fastidiosa]